ncbi:MAG: tetracycline resistance MFS efflux pump [Ignavibacteriae bacterium]|nr:MAG: tetracycline resistance MFS efflux pump [Ignavibacteriota bacterium]
MKTKASLTVIFITVFIDLLGFGLLIPILPTFASKELGISDVNIGIIIASFSFMQFLFNPIIGSYSDKIGRKPIIMGTLLITAASYIIFSFATSFWILLFSRMLAGFGGSNIAAAQAYIADVTSHKDRSKGMGLIGAAFGLGFVFGPMIGGILSQYGYEIVGYAAAGFSFLAFIFASVFLKESLVHKSYEKKSFVNVFTRKAYQPILNSKKLSFYVLIYFVIIFSMANIYGTFALLGYKVYSFSDKDIGYIYTIIGIIGAIIQAGFLKQLSKRIGDNKLVVTGIFFMMLGLAGLPYGVNFMGVVLVAIILSIGSAILQPTMLSLISREIDEKKQGSVLGLNQSLASLARVLGPLWGGIAFDYLGYEFPFITGGIFTFGALVYAIHFLGNHKRKTKKNT